MAKNFPASPPAYLQSARKVGSDKPLEEFVVTAPSGSDAPGSINVDVHATKDTTTGMSNMKNMDQMSGMSNMTGDADRDFLRMMSDHHKGLILLAHMTKDRKDGGTSKADASKLDAAQDKELDIMQTMLETDFKDPYAAKAPPENQAMADALRGKRGAEYERTFYQDIIQHHQGALQMIDAYLPTARSAAIRRMAEQMKVDQTKEIAEFRTKVAAIR